MLGKNNYVCNQIKFYTNFRSNMDLTSLERSHDQTDFVEANARFSHDLAVATLKDIQFQCEYRVLVKLKPI